MLTAVTAPEVFICFIRQKTQVCSCPRCKPPLEWQVNSVTRLPREQVWLPHWLSFLICKIGPCVYRAASPQEVPQMLLAWEPVMRLGAVTGQTTALRWEDVGSSLDSCQGHILAAAMTPLGGLAGVRLAREMWWWLSFLLAKLGRLFRK